MSPKEDIVVLSSFEEIVFSKRNKEYGAYYLRKRYKRYLIVAFFLSFFLIASAVVVPLLNSYYNKSKQKKLLEKSVSVELEDVEDAPPPPPPPPPPAELQAQVKFQAPVVVDTVKEEVVLTTFDESIEAAAVAEAPPTTIVVEEKKEEVVEKEEAPFLVVEEPATFQGGDLSNFNAWVLQNIKYPQLAVENGISGKVYVQFTVNQKGMVTDAKVLRGVDNSLDQEAIRVIQSSPKWTPPKQGGRPVKQLFTLPVVFKLQE
jgi:protein TonB